MPELYLKIILMAIPACQGFAKPCLEIVPFIESITIEIAGVNKFVNML
jgi:hypothetical protein